MGNTECCAKREEESDASAAKRPPASAQKASGDPCSTATLDAAILGVNTTDSVMVSALNRATVRSSRHAVTGRYHHSPRSVDQDYAIDLTKVLGTGSTGAVVKGRDRGTGSIYAIKSFNLRNLSDVQREQVQSEAEIFLSMDHPHVVALVNVYESEDELILVMECMTGGEVFERVQKQAQFSELDTSEAVWQILLAVHYLHGNSVVHRDLKLENFLYDRPGSSHLKLIDFGLSHIWDRDEKMAASCGTLSYVAPEVLNKSYTSQCDLWSLGVATFILLLGYMPFDGPHSVQVRNIKAGAWIQKPHRWNALSPVARDFIKRLLVVDADKRLTAEEALKHEFIAGRQTRQSANDSSPIDETIKDALIEYANSSKFRRACMSMMSFSLTNEERAQVRQAFFAMDTDDNGTITLGEFKQAFLKYAVEDRADTMDENIREIFNRLDTGHNEVIHYHEFLAAMVSTRIKVHETMLRQTFRQFDKDRTGYISAGNLRTVLGETFDGTEVEELMLEADANCDGVISFEEFTAFLERKLTPRKKETDAEDIA